MLNYKYNPLMVILIGYCVQAAELDIFNGPTIYESIFEFKQTDPFNETFELFGMGDMNFMMNLASLPIWYSISVIYGIICKFILCLAKIGYKA